MLQTSISAWLRTPKAVAEPPAAPSSPEHPPTNTSTKATTAAIPLPPTASPTPAPPQRSVIQAASPTPAPSSRKSRPLPPNITLEPASANTLPSLRRLNSLLLPIPYPTKFYDEILADPVTSSITLVALWHATLPAPPAVPAAAPDSTTSTRTLAKPRLVAGIRCRLLPSSDRSSAPVLYVSTLATLSPYRSLGLASHLLHAVMARASTTYGVVDVAAHVWEANTEALEWYEKRGFEVRGREEGYYRRLSPSGAFCVGRKVGVGDLVGSGAFGREERREGG